MGNQRLAHQEGRERQGAKGKRTPSSGEIGAEELLIELVKTREMEGTIESFRGSEARSTKRCWGTMPDAL